ncbi:sugar ABC transporter ATP-binding protein [Ramlibacter monticola]|uniref:Sugar ABC transporter ATP-binding protein n=1 Tax=Ramlibacter monticola TaxID=1926872 RepID=A0A937CTE5_9BURK|nr:sugar ABC transporter ATP-binding protein [Ramlibacter monticola]MBL0392475.1 sugar ABC transporter ATP-binding protein [Ramlibacter monticola]
MTPAQPVLELAGISKSFLGVRALAGVDLRLQAGEVHALMGQNGAGKSTLIKVLTGVYPADAGTIRIAGEAVRPRSPLEAQRLGVSTVYQEVNLCPNLSVAENIFAGRYPRRWGTIAWRTMEDRARALLARLNVNIDVGRLLSAYPMAVQQMVAIARALSVDARVLVLDEPTSSLDEDEVRRLFAVLRRLRDEGMAILFVTHFLEQVYAIADRITVLRNGERVGEYRAEHLSAPALVAAMVGRELAARREAAPAPAAAAGGEALVELRGLGSKGVVHPTDLALRAGEVVGLAGLLGSGRTELARLLFGLERADKGELRVRGAPVRVDRPRQAVALGMGLLPEDRQTHGIVSDLSLRENIVLALQARRGVLRNLGAQEQQRLAEGLVRALGIKAASLDAPIAQLSGGNQQKALLARWLATQPSLLILDEPTRGIDVAAKQEVMDEILRLAGEGMAVLFISSEIDEVVRVSHRIAVLRDRHKVGELPAGGQEQDVYRLIAEEA